MVPTWVITALVFVLAAIAACYVGATLPEYEYTGALILFVVIICTVCAVTNNFPLLLALGLWMPFSLPIPTLRAFPLYFVVTAWIVVILFFRLCLMGSLRYVPSFNWLFLACFAWVPVRYLITPTHGLGGLMAGGSGISGLNAYFLYAFAGIALITVGAALPTRQDIIALFRWSMIQCLILGGILCACAFIPATTPYLDAMGMFQAGDIGDGVQRIVILPGFGYMLCCTSLFPQMFRLSRTQAFGCFCLGFAMMIIGGNRLSMTGFLIFLPLALWLRRDTNTLVIGMAGLVMFCLGVRLWANSVDVHHIPAMARSLGMLDPRIEEASGGKASEEWRYEVWKDGVKIIMQHPLLGKGFGNLPKHEQLVPGMKAPSDFEFTLAAGGAHNGMVVAAYGFGIPFFLALLVGSLQRIYAHIRLSRITDPHDQILRQFHGFVAASTASGLIQIYLTVDFSATVFWVTIGAGIVMENLMRRAAAAETPATPPQQVEGYATARRYY
jgi:hypothetical protein